MSSSRSFRFTLALNFGLVYVFWGSTYLGIDIAVQHIPPALVCGTRFTIAGLIMIGYCIITGKNIRYNAKELAQFAAVGLLLLMGGNLTLSFAELYVPSGLSALLLAITPLWFLVFDSLLLGHYAMSGRGMAGLALGLVGTVVLLWPDLHTTGAVGRKELWWGLALVAASSSWATGSILSKKWHSGFPTLSGTAWQVLFAGLANLAFSLLHHDLGHATWSVSGIVAISYLIVCGSLIGYTAYIYILAHAPTAKVSTYAYVNPVVAVFLGWLVLHEKIDAYIVTGSAIVIASVILVTSASVVPKKATQLQPIESAAD
jgi:drug/metabolite transporter (DMT)-like permease